MKKLSKQLAVMAITGCMVASAIPSYATDYSNTRIQNSKLVFSEETEEDSVNIDDILPVDLDVSHGTASGTQFSDTFALTSRNGKKVNFWVRNNGKVSVKLTINGKAPITLEPGEQGHTYTDVSYLSSNYKFKVVPVPNGGDIDIEYRIAQRDN